jgi:hypothetical protein
MAATGFRTMPPSGTASGYVGFDVMAMLVAPTLLYAAAKLKPKRATRRVHEARAGRCIEERRELAAAEDPPWGRRFGHLVARPDANLARLNE